MNNKEYTNNYYKNALSLAFLGDSVFTLMVRKLLIESSEAKPNVLNKIANEIVCARNQAKIMRELKSKLKEDELDIVMRARNGHTNNKAKNSTLEEYSLSTQFEALIGYWYLNNDLKKIENVFDLYVKNDIN